MREELGRYSQDDLTRLVLARDEIDELLTTRLPSNDYSLRNYFYAECGAALVLDVLALRSIVDFELVRPRGRSGEWHYCHCTQADSRLWWVLPPCPSWADEQGIYLGWLSKAIDEGGDEYDEYYQRALLWGGRTTGELITPITLPSAVLSERAVRRIAAGRAWEEQKGEPWVPCLPAYGRDLEGREQKSLRKVLVGEFFQK